jgi:hypothetical protein
MVSRCALAVVIAGLVLSGCAPALTKEQDFAYRAVEDCRASGLQTGWTYWVLPNGSIRFEGRADGFSAVQTCLTQKYGYKF